MELTEEEWLKLQEIVSNARKSPTFHTDIQAQLLVVELAAHFFPQTSKERRRWIESQLTALIPRVRNAPNKEDMLLWLLKVGRLRGREDIARSLRYQTPSSFLEEPEESLYPTEGWLGEYITWAKHSELPVGFHFWAALGALGAACRHNFYVDRGQYNLRLNNYIILVANKGIGKSHAMNLSLEILRRANELIRPEDLTPGTSHPYEIRILAEDTNVETLTQALQFTTGVLRDAAGNSTRVDIASTGMMALDELTTFLGVKTWNVERRIPWLVTMYSSDNYTYETKGSGKMVLKNLALSMIACTAPDWFTSAMTPLMFGGGFMDRTLYIYRGRTERSYPTPEPTDPIAALKLAERLAEISEVRDSVEMMPRGNANKWYIAWYNRQLDNNPITDMSKARQANHLWKLAALLSLSEGTEPYIDDTHLDAAAKYLKIEESYFEEFDRARSKSATSDGVRIILKLLRKHNGKLTKARLYQFLNGQHGFTPPSKHAPMYVESAKDMEYIEIEPYHGGYSYAITQKGLDFIQKD